MSYYFKQNRSLHCLCLLKPTSVLLPANLHSLGPLKWQPNASLYPHHLLTKPGNLSLQPLDSHCQFCHPENCAIRSKVEKSQKSLARATRWLNLAASALNASCTKPLEPSSCLPAITFGSFKMLGLCLIFCKSILLISQ